MSNEKTLHEGSVWKLIGTMSLPVIVVMLLQVLYNMADVFFMGRTGQTMQVAAIGLAGPVFTVISAFNTLIGFGGCTAVSMALGRGDSQQVKQYSSFVLWFGLAAGAAVGAALLLCMEPLVHLLGANAETASYTSSYLRILALGAPFSIAGGALGNSIRADGDSKGAMLASTLGIGINIALDPLFISGFGWGITGAAIATVLGNLVSLLALLLVSRKKEGFSISLKDFTLRPQVSLKVLGYGLPMAAGTLLMSFSGIFSNRLLVAYGNSAVAAQGVAGKAGMFICMIVMGICMGVQPAVSYNFGAGDRKRVNRIVLGVGAFAVALGAVLAAAIAFFRTGFVAAFLDVPAVTSLGTRMVTVSLIGAPFYGIYQMSSIYLQGTGKVSYATLTSLLRQGIVLVPVLFLLNSLFGLSGYLWAGVVADLISTGIGAALCLKWAGSQKRAAGSGFVFGAQLSKAV